jgi:6-phosphogluconolactonase/glucosamine-6-phosphate isomerase/deaminase
VIAILSGNEKADIAKKIFQKDLDLPIVKVLSQRKSSMLFVEESIMPDLAPSSAEAAA